VSHRQAQADIAEHLISTKSLNEVIEKALRQAQGDFVGFSGTALGYQCYMHHFFFIFAKNVFNQVDNPQSYLLDSIKPPFEKT
jgi:hypothetical protein